MVKVLLKENYDKEQVREIWNHVKAENEILYIRDLINTSYPWRMKNSLGFILKFEEVVDYALDKYLEELKLNNSHVAKFKALKKTNNFYSGKSTSEKKIIDLFGN